MARTRAKAKGRKGGEQDRFARLPVNVLESAAVCTLNHAAFKILVLLAAQYSGHNNGTMAMTEIYSRKFGFNSRDTLYRALADLEARGLIVKTRAGIRIKRLYSLYALGWLDIDSRDGRLLEHSESAPQGWRNYVPAIGSDRKKLRTDGRESMIPIVGSDDPKYVPISPSEAPVSVPTIGNTLRSTPQVCAIPPSDPLPGPVPHPLRHKRPSAKSESGSASSTWKGDF